MLRCLLYNSLLAVSPREHFQLAAQENFRNGNEARRERSKSPKITFRFRIYENARAV